MTDDDARTALFLMLGQSAERAVTALPDVVPAQRLPLSQKYDLALVLPDEVREATRAALVYRLFFVFENFLRQFVLDALSEEDKENWWSKIPTDVQNEVLELEKNEEAKAWMSLGSRDKLSLTTYAQLLRIIEARWKQEFEDSIRDKSLIQSARQIGHLRNAICHMTAIPEEEVERVKMVMRDWFRMVPP